MITLYSALLLDIRKSSYMASSICSPMGDCNMIPTSTPNILDDLSTWRIHHYSLFLGIVRPWGNSTMKLTRTYHLRECRGLYHMPYSLNSIAHFIIHLERFGLFRVIRNGKFANIVTWWAWKYGWFFLVATCSIKVVCSTWEYLILASTKALLI